MAASYNELMGLGSHSEDANLEGWWPLQDDAASTVVDDQSSNGNDGTSTDNTSVISGTGPNGYLTKAFDWASATGNIALPDVGLDWASIDFTVLHRVVTSATGNKDNLFFVNNGFPKEWSTSRKDFSNSYGWDYNYGTTQVLTSSSPVNTGTWIDIALEKDDTNLAMYFNGSSVATGSGTTTSSSSGAVTLVATGTDWLGSVCDVSFWSRVLSSDEKSEWTNGPELNYVSGASIDEDGNYDAGTHALPSPFASGSNGTATYEVVAVNAAGSVLDSDTTATGTLDLSSEAGNTCYLLVRVSNTGGYDIGDKATRTSGYGSSGDGYYELASVTAAGGGGGAHYGALVNSSILKSKLRGLAA